MKKFKFIFIFCVVILLLSGCSKLIKEENGTAKIDIKELVSKYIDNLDTDSISYTSDVFIDMDTEISKTNLSLDMSVSSKNKYFKNEKSYSNITGNVNISNMEIPIQSEIYTILEEDKYISYVKENDEWTKKEEESIESYLDDILKSNLKDVEWDIKESNNEYILTGNIEFEFNDDELNDIVPIRSEGNSAISIVLDQNKNIKNIDLDLSSSLLPKNQEVKLDIKTAKLSLHSFDFSPVSIDLPEDRIQETGKESTSGEVENIFNVELAESFEWKEEYGNIFINNKSVKIGEKANQFTIQTEPIYVNPGDLEFISPLVNNETISFGVMNNTNTIEISNNCTLFEVSFFNSEYSTVEFSSIINKDDTKELIIEKLGNPTYSSMFDNDLFLSWDSNEGKYISVIINKDNKILSITIGGIESVLV